MLPLVHELARPPLPEQAFQQFAHLPHALFIDSALRHPELGKYSFLAADPFAYWELPVGAEHPFDRLKETLAKFPAETVPDLPPWQGGAAGLFSYDLGHSLERLPRTAFDEFGLPALAIGLYDVVLAFDHAQDRAWIISQGFPETDPQKRLHRATARRDEMLAWLEGSPRKPVRSAGFAQRKTLPAEQLAPQYPVTGKEKITSNFTAEAYQAAVQRVIDYIHAGDAFQVNLSQRLLYPAETDAVELYLRLRERNPAPFAAYFDLGEFQICSASPERFLLAQDGMVEARPIKGTRARTSQVEANFYRGEELILSEKDRAENVMIVDLMRNDLAKVCEAESVRVSQLCGLETYAFVQHLVSVIEGKLLPEHSPLDLLRAAFPGGSITGAPKVRAMEIIAELEPTARGAYCGSLGYLGFDGSLDTSILIRTITAGRGWWQLPVGGGIVAQSNPASELAETWHKAEGMLRALQ
jgi:para-aminobenzoate synthetase component I